MKMWYFHLYFHSPCFILETAFPAFNSCFYSLQKKKHLKVEIQDVQVIDFLHLLLSYVAMLTEYIFQSLTFPVP